MTLILPKAPPAIPVVDDDAARPGDRREPPARLSATEDDLREALGALAAALTDVVARFDADRPDRSLAQDVMIELGGDGGEILLHSDDEGLSNHALVERHAAIERVGRAAEALRTLLMRTPILGHDRFTIKVSAQPKEGFEDRIGLLIDDRWACQPAAVSAYARNLARRLAQLEAMTERSEALMNGLPFRDWLVNGLPSRAPCAATAAIASLIWTDPKRLTPEGMRSRPVEVKLRIEPDALAESIEDLLASQ